MLRTSKHHVKSEAETLWIYTPHNVLLMMNVIKINPRQLWHQAMESLWLFPLCSVLIALFSAEFFIWADKNFFSDMYAMVPWLFIGTPAAAADILTTIAASMITVVSIAFSMTLIAIQQAASQYSPRVVSTVTSDKGNQIVLGAYMGTFVYSLSVLKSIRYTQDNLESQFVPSVAVLIAFLLAVICLLMLIWFIHNVSTSLKVSDILKKLHITLLSKIDTMYPESIGDDAQQEVNPQQMKHKTFIVAWTHGYIGEIDEEPLKKVDSEDITYIEIHKHIGDFVVEGEPIATVYTNNNTKGISIVLEKAISISLNRTISQDILFPIQQITDIALRALSPGINDPYTAIESIHFLSNALKKLAHKQKFNETRYIKESKVYLKASVVSWLTIITKSLGLIQKHGKSFTIVQEQIINAGEQISRGNLDSEKKKVVDSLINSSEKYITSESK